MSWIPSPLAVGPGSYACNASFRTFDLRHQTAGAIIPVDLSFERRQLHCYGFFFSR
jgi:hypothetical protein